MSGKPAGPQFGQVLKIVRALGSHTAGARREVLGPVSECAGRTGSVIRAALLGDALALEVAPEGVLESAPEVPATMLAPQPKRMLLGVDIEPS